MSETGDGRTDLFNHVAKYECKGCGHEWAIKTHARLSQFDEECPGCGVETTHALTKGPVDIDLFWRRYDAHLRH